MPISPLSGFTEAGFIWWPLWIGLVVLSSPGRSQPALRLIFALWRWKSFYFGCPKIFNTDQGSQFTSTAFTGKLKEQDVRISMDGRGRVFDNIFTERSWHSPKYEEVYLKNYQNVSEAKQGIGQYMTFYNHERLHQSLNYQTPVEVYFQRSVIV